MDTNERRLSKRINDNKNAKVEGPSSSIDEHIVVFDSTGGKKVKDGGIAKGDLYHSGNYGVVTEYSPSVSAASGSFNNCIVTGVYAVMGGLIYLELHISIVDKGTATGAVKVTLPKTATSYNVMVGREDAATGKMLQGRTNGNYLDIFDYANSSPIVNGAVIRITGFYR